MRRVFCSAASIAVLVVTMCVAGATAADAQINSVTVEGVAYTTDKTVPGKGGGTISWSLSNSTIWLDGYKGGSIEIATSGNSGIQMKIEKENIVTGDGHSANAVTVSGNAPGGLNINGAGVLAAVPYDRAAAFGIASDGDIEITGDAGLYVPKTNASDSGIKIGDGKKFEVNTRGAVKIKPGKLTHGSHKTDISGANLIRGILIAGDAGWGRGRFRLSQNFAVERGEALAVESTADITVGENMAIEIRHGGVIINGGLLVNDGKILDSGLFENKGTIKGGGTIYVRGDGEFRGNPGTNKVVNEDNPLAALGGCDAGAFGLIGAAALAVIKKRRRG